MTYREINDHLPEDMHDTDQIENVVNMINDMGILVYDKAPEPDALLLKEDSETDEEDTEAALTTAVESEFGRTTDPMRMIETINKLSRIQRQILQEKGREALPEELAERMDMPEEKIRKVLKIAKEPVDPDITVALYPDEYFPFLRDSAARECTSTDFTLKL